MKHKKLKISIQSSVAKLHVQCSNKGVNILQDHFLLKVKNVYNNDTDIFNIDC